MLYHHHRHWSRFIESKQGITTTGTTTATSPCSFPFMTKLSVATHHRPDDLLEKTGFLHI
jgi:hypothetical protein